MQFFGLQHVNSEVPKIVAERLKKRMDIFGYDLETSIPIILELKTKRDPDVIDQVCEYVAFISHTYPDLFEQLNAFRNCDGFQFNYRKGIVGIVLSPEPAPSQLSRHFECPILWAQYTFSDNHTFSIVDRHVLSRSATLVDQFKKPSRYQRRRASEYAHTTLPGTRDFLDRLDEMFLSVGPTINLREKYDHSYIAYYATDAPRALFGFNTGKSKTNLHVEFHVYGGNHERFRSLSATKGLASIGLGINRVQKNQIYGIRFDESVARNSSTVVQSLNLFKEMASACYSYEKIPELSTLHVDPQTRNGLSLRACGLADE